MYICVDRYDKKQIRNYKSDSKRKQREGGKQERKKKKIKGCLLVPEAGGCVGLEESLATLSTLVLLW